MNFSAIVRHYIMYHRKRKAGELDWFRNQPTLEAAVEKATRATIQALAAATPPLPNRS